MVLTEEGSSLTASVCAQIDSGILEREVVAFLSTTTRGTTTGIQSVHKHDRLVM